MDKKVLIMKTSVVVIILAIISAIVFGCFFNQNNSITEQTNYQLSELENLKAEKKDVSVVSGKEVYGNVIINNDNYGKEYGRVVSRDGWQGEILVGGTLSNSYGHYYWNASNNNGYCLDKDLEAGGTATTSKYYELIGDAYEKMRLPSATNTEANKNQIRWLLDNIARVNVAYIDKDKEYLENVSNEEISFYRENLANIIVTYTKNTDGTPAYTLDSARKVIKEINNVDLFFVQQWAMWHITNPNSNKLNNSYLKQGNETVLFNALLNGAKQNSNYSSEGNEKASADVSKATIEKDGSNLLIGPITIKNPNKKTYKMTYGNFKINNEDVTVKLVKSDKKSVIENNVYTNFGSATGETVYVLIENFNLDKVNTKYTITGDINPLSYTTIAKYWEAYGASDYYQQVVTLNRTPNDSKVKVETEYTIKEGDYTVSIEKINEDGESVDLKNENIFAASVNGQAMVVDTINKGTVKYKKVTVTENTSDENDRIVIIEKVAPYGYTKYDKKIELDINKVYNGEKYIGNVGKVYIDGVEATRNEVTGGYSYDDGNVFISWNNGIINVKVVNVVNGMYRLNLVKKSFSDENVLDGSKFDIKYTTQNADIVGEFKDVRQVEFFKGNILLPTMDIKDLTTQDIYVIKETDAPFGYQKLSKKYVLQLHKLWDKDDLGCNIIDKINLYEFDLNEDVTGASLNENSEKYKGSIIPGETYRYNDEYQKTSFKVEFNKDGININLTALNKKVDLALRKLITEVADINNSNDVVKTYEIPRKELDDKEWKDAINLSKYNNAIYNMNKKPVEVSAGQQVSYALMVFNEGQVAAKALELNDYIPTGLTVTGVYYKDGNTEITKSNTINNADLVDENYYYYDEEKGFLNIRLGGADLINPHLSTELNYDYVIVKCIVNDNAEGILTNVAEISKYATTEGEVENDIDSTPNNWISPNAENDGGKNVVETDKSTDEWREYTNNHDEYLNGYNSIVSQDSSVNGLEGDDDDFEKLVVRPKYELILKKVNASNNNQAVSDVLFNVTVKDSKRDTEEKFENVNLENGIKTFTGDIDVGTSIINNDEISYIIEEIQNNDYVQLEKPIKLSLLTNKGYIVGYRLSYDNDESAIFYMNDKTFTFRSKEGTNLDVTVKFEKETNKVEMIISNKVIQPNQYSLKLRKISSGSGVALEGVTFSVDKYSYENGKRDEVTPETINFDETDSNGYTNSVSCDINFQNYNKIDEYVIKEIDLGSNTIYNKLNKDIYFYVNKKYNKENDVFEIESCSVKVDDNIQDCTNGAKLTIEENGIKYYCNITRGETNEIEISLTNAPDISVPLQIKKVNKDNESESVTGTEFTVSKENTILYQDVDLTGVVSLEDKIEHEVTNLTYKVVEENAAEGFDNVLAGKYIKVDVTLDGTSGEITGVMAQVYNSDDTRNTQLDENVSASVEIIDGIKTVVLKIKNPETVKTLDLALKKIITEVNGREVKQENGFEEKFDRLTSGTDKYRVNTTPLQQGKTNAEYYLNKTAVLVQKGDTIKYQIRIYNEGSEQNATASKIIDYLPDGLDFVNIYYRNENTPLTSNTDYVYNSQFNYIEINALNNKDLINKYDGDNDVISYDYLTVECRVRDDAEGIQTNVAEIMEYKTENGIVDSDVDSEPANWKNPVDNDSRHNKGINKSILSWVSYKGNKQNVLEEGKFKNYKGQQDDDDFEKVKVVEVDLVLKKIITHINEDSPDALDLKYARFQDDKVKVDTSEMVNNYDVTTAKYYLNKTPIKVRVDDIVTYQIRIYNEGSLDATASEIIDYIPKGLSLVSVNYNGTDLIENVNYTIDNENVLKITAMKNDLIASYTGTKWDYAEPSYKYVTVKCKVNGDVKGLLTNVAEISKYQIASGEITSDRDSETVGDGEWQAPEGSNKLTLDGKSGLAWATYYNNIQIGNFVNYEGQQDDDDFEKINVVAGYNLQLKKISEINPNKGLEGFKFDVIQPNNIVTTDENGYTEKFGPFELNSVNTLDVYQFIETAVGSDQYIKLAQPIYLFVEKYEDNDGKIKIKGFYINTKEPKPGYDYYRISDGFEHSFFVKDEQGFVNTAKIKITDDEVNVGGYDISITVENSISSKYSLYLRKEDGNNKPIKDVLFRMKNLSFGDFYNEYTTDLNGIVCAIKDLPINRGNVGKVDKYVIDEIDATDKYYKLNESIELSVYKGYNPEIDNYEVTKLLLRSSNGQVSEEGKEIVISDVVLKDTNQKVKVKAKVDNNVIVITVENIEKEFDLALRKFITTVNGKKINESREPQVDVSKLASGDSTTATYNHTKEPLPVKLNDVVGYTIRVYNEGPRDGYAQLVMDDVPTEVSMIAPEFDDNGNPVNTNAKYRWKMYRRVENGETVLVEETIQYAGNSYVLTDNPEEAKLIVTDYLSKENGENLKENDNSQNPNLITAFNGITMTQPDYRDVVVEFKVKNNNKPNTIITNYAQITDDADKNGNKVTDIDSTPNVWEEAPRNDDQDIENIVVIEEKEFDLALRKYISGVNGVELTGDDSREPKVDTTELVKGNTTTAEYKHTKDAKLVNPTDIVEYTLRVYNEGDIDGYANLIMDDVPAGVDMIAPEYDESGKPVNTNAKYRWVMYRKANGFESDESLSTAIRYNNDTYVVTKNDKEAVLIVTDYLSKEVNAEENLIKAFDIEKNILDSKDIKVEFKVKSTNKADTIITNYAQITDDTDKEGNPVEDRDSTPNVWEETPRNDDQDIENIKVAYFDLALYKWVTSTLVTEDGKTIEYDSKHTQSDKSNLVNVVIPKDKLNDIVVKFKYQIKVENQGQIAGYAKQIKDHIPEGLKFIAEDNKDYGWVLEEDGTITTDYLKDTLLKKDETAEVTVVLTWINSENNLHTKINYAEISEDYNDYDDSADIDSTPDNFDKEPVEDDEDKDIVMLTIRTGGENMMYVMIGLVVVSIITVGIFGVKKFVIK